MPGLLSSQSDTAGQALIAEVTEALRPKTASAGLVFPQDTHYGFADA